ncbi:MAG: hypothetical protein IKW87_09980 [Ruminococcus sp.]|nr:hypothetical protein [Ruminococcus sp.]
MNYQEWLEWRKTIDPAKESRQEGCILSISTAAEKIKEEGSKEFGEKTAAYGMALNTLYLGDEYVTEEEWQKAYGTAYDYVNNELKNEDNFKELITTGIESSSMGENARDLFINLEEVNRDLELNADLKWYAEKNSEINPNSSNDMANLLGVELDQQKIQENIKAKQERERQQQLNNQQPAPMSVLNPPQQFNHDDNFYRQKYTQWQNTIQQNPDAVKNTKEIHDHFFTNGLVAVATQAQTAENKDIIKNSVYFSNAVMKLYNSATPYEDWKKSYDTAENYTQQYLNKTENLKLLLDKGAHGENPKLGKNGVVLFRSFRQLNRDFSMSIDMLDYSNKFDAVIPGSKNEMLAELNVPQAQMQQQMQQNNNELDDGIEIEGLETGQQLDMQGNIVDQNGNIVTHADTNNNTNDNDGDFAELENININQLAEEMQEVHEQGLERDRINREAEEREKAEEFEEITDEDVEEAERKSAALAARNEELKKKALADKERRLKEAQEKALRDKAAAAERKKKAAEEEKQKAEAEKKEKLEREARRREPIYEVKDNKAYERSENSMLRDMFKDEEKELNAKHANWIRGTNTKAHDDLTEAYETFMESLDTKSKHYSRDTKSKCKMKLKQTAEAYIKAKKDYAKTRGQNVDDPDWMPKSKMGRRRYRSALAIIKKINSTETDYDRLVMFEDDLVAKRWTGRGGSSDDHTDLSRSFKSLKNYLKYENKNSDPELKQKLMDDLRRDAERYLKKIAGSHLNDPKWEPKTTMGARRFAAAKAVIIRLNQMEGKTLKKQQTKNQNNPTMNQQQPQQQNNGSAGQQQRNNDEMRRNVSDETRLQQDNAQNRRRNSVTPTSNTPDRFKEEQQRKREKNEERYETPFDAMSVDALKGTTRKRSKKGVEDENGIVRYNGKILTRISEENLKKKSLTTLVPEILTNIFMNACAVMLGSGNLAKNVLGDEAFEQNKEALKNNKEFMDKVKKMTPEQLREGIKNPAKAYNSINDEIMNDKYGKLLEDNKKTSAATNEILDQQNLYLNTVAIKHAMARRDTSPEAINNARNAIAQNKEFMNNVEKMTNNEFKEGINSPDVAYAAFSKAEAKYNRFARNIDIADNYERYRHRSQSEVSALNRVSAKSCCNAMDHLIEISKSEQPLTEKQKKDARKCIAIMTADEYIKNDTNNTLHNEYSKSKDTYKKAVNGLLNSAEFKKALPPELDANYIKNFLAAKNNKGPKHIQSLVLNHKARIKTQQNETLTTQPRRKTIQKNNTLDNNRPSI